MEERCYHPLPEVDRVSSMLPPADMLPTGVTRSIREMQPADYTLQIDSFSILSDIFSERRVERYESGCFEAGGYKWRLSLYPNGDQKRDGNGHLSLYLVLAETDTFPVGLEVFVNFKLFVYDQIRDRYLTVQDADGKVRRFHKTKPEYGFSRLISLTAFHNASNGYLVEDSCVFGAEVFVIKNKSKAERLTMIKDPVISYTLEVDNFSKLNGECYRSHDFTCGGTKWRLLYYPRGDLEGKQDSLSLYLQLADCVRSPSYLGWFQGYKSKTLPQESKVYVECILCVRDQVHGRNKERKFHHWFSAASPSIGYSSFMSLKDLYGRKRGFLKNDIFIVNIAFDVVFAANQDSRIRSK
ncbi:hypothetical protein L1049_012563 [Liquidambar formosana]|uniref:MATH domain-containing protein n=1 Tax=Liquidambar formosana TaxID=63359 RepID=A0AAP0N1Y2_LIQFO